MPLTKDGMRNSYTQVCMYELYEVLLFPIFISMMYTMKNQLFAFNLENQGQDHTQLNVVI